ncbi:non-homologous end-joining DNA ligase [Desulfomonile tiedjei]|uniref:DNA polymerase LigD, polymerase domain protein n=1 Tax=Desulfomonile tiedjei (strain ATCC 49306 / DSM 6799 / DCB-1) TaxID=706587 RepID=I4BZY9_DESTA|nr:non-homologous end-joining DNA ligase [Desulfomonile tiedjei]AFM22880.1 DNA polymerase LigD, polymerase domain protein [Desulfomonile tiedjei DSM 6799]
MKHTRSDNTKSSITIEGKKLHLTNLDKVLYPATGFTKGQVIEYYAKISEVLLPHVKNRPLTLKRYPNGVDGEYFYEKMCPSHHPDWIQTTRVASQHRKFVDYCTIDGLASLIWVANLASLELHTSLSHSDNVLRPSMIVFDLDPGEPAGLLQCVEVSLIFRDMLRDLGLAGFAKTSGGKGLHLYVPLNTETDYDRTKTFAQALARSLAKRMPKLVTANMRKDLRKGKVFVDWSQNDDHKTTVCVYSLRAREKPTVSAPIAWSTLETCHKKKNASGLVLDTEQVLKQVEKEGDLFAEVVSLRQKLPELAV